MSRNSKANLRQGTLVSSLVTTLYIFASNFYFLFALIITPFEIIAILSFKLSHFCK